ncbi:MAG: WecB/TagA/CpsF family glycosyltransferase [Acidimicrobiales bacterium]
MPEHGPAHAAVVVRDLLGLPVHAFDCAGFGRWMAEASAGSERPTLVGYVNAATVDLAASDGGFAERLARFDCLVADGQSIVWAARHLAQPLPERVNVTDVVSDVLGAVAARGVSVALVGGRPGDAEGFATVMRRACPQLDVVLTASGYLDEAGEREVLRSIAALDPGLVLLGMGAPLQEERAERWSAEGEPRVWWCVGAVFEYFVGRRRRAPVWVRRAGLEWVVRFAQEPRRLARRYLVGNPRFLWRVARRRPVRTA